MIITLEELIPIPRYDGKPFTQADLYESASPIGPWTLIDTFVFPDPDVDPTEPKMRSFTTENATIADGWYQVIFSDLDGDLLLPTVPMQAPQPLPQNYVPQIQDVGSILRTRTLIENGEYLGTFTPATRPTGAQVQNLIALAVPELASMVGDTVPNQFIVHAQYLVALKAAMHVELAYYPEQIAANKSMYAQLKDLYDEGVKALLVGIEAAGDDGVLDPGELGSALSPAYGFPVNAGGLVGWDTVM